MGCSLPVTPGKGDSISGGNQLLCLGLSAAGRAGCLVRSSQQSCWQPCCGAAQLALTCFAELALAGRDDAAELLWRSIRAVRSTAECIWWAELGRRTSESNGTSWRRTSSTWSSRRPTEELNRGWKHPVSDASAMGSLQHSGDWVRGSYPVAGTPAGTEAGRRSLIGCTDAEQSGPLHLS